MFGKKKIKAVRIDTLVGCGTLVTGDIYYRGGLHIEGKVKGNLVAESNEKTILIVSEKGYVEGDVKGPVIILNGTVEGDVYSSVTLELARHAKVKGSVYYKLLEMEVGAEVNGSLIHQSVSSAKIEQQALQGSGQPENITGHDEAALTAESR